jgi:hypothetical protein
MSRLDRFLSRSMSQIALCSSAFARSMTPSQSASYSAARRKSAPNDGITLLIEAS